MTSSWNKTKINRPKEIKERLVMRDEPLNPIRVTRKKTLMLRSLRVLENGDSKDVKISLKYDN